MCTLDQETLTLIVETSTNVKNIMTRLDKGSKEYDKLEARLRKLEQLIIPVMIIVGYISHKFFEWAHL